MLGRYYDSFWSDGGVCIVAVVHRQGPTPNWAAYIGSAEGTNVRVAMWDVSKYGVKLAIGDARYFFPDLAGDATLRWRA